MTTLAGIHHVTAIAGNPAGNLAFYTQVLGLRLVKRTVNFDAPDTWHLYYGDDLGRPGTLLTFFLWSGLRRGVRGAGQAVAFSYRVPPGTLGWWSDRLRRHGVTPAAVTRRFEEEALAFDDPEGLGVELVGDARAPEQRPRAGGPVPEEYALRAFGPVTLAVQGYEQTARLLRDIMGLRPAGEEANRFRFETVSPEGAPGAPAVDVLCRPGLSWGRVATGSVHHVAWRAHDEEAQRAWRERLVAAGLDVTPVIDRCYFKSVYFREPGGTLFEIATDSPGMTVDESAESLGARLALPPWFEAQRADIERGLPPLGG